MKVHIHLNIKEQSILLDGKRFFPEDIRQLKAMVTEETPVILGDLYQFLDEWFSDSSTMIVHTSGSTGTPKELTVSKDRMMQSARLTCEKLALTEGSTALLCMPLRYIAGKMMVVRALVAGLNLIVRTPSGHPLANVTQKIRFAAMVPLQIYNTLEVPGEQARLRDIDILIIGGGMIHPSLARKLASFPGEVYATYGMTETLSHIALCRLNGSQADGSTYYPFPEVKISLSPSDTLVINAPLVCGEELVTHDVASIGSDGGFVILGREDTIINSGGIKLQPEVMEKWMQNVLSVPFVFTSVPDERLGEAVVLLVEGTMGTEELRALLDEHLPAKYSYVKRVVSVSEIPLTGYGKIDRTACRELAFRKITGG